MTADRFITKHLMNINNNIKLFKSKELRNCYPTKRKLSYSHKIKSNDNIFDFEIEIKIGNKESEEVKKNYPSDENKKFKIINHLDIVKCVESESSDKCLQVSNNVKQSDSEYSKLTESHVKLTTDDDSDKNSTNIESASDSFSDDNSYSKHNSKNKKEPMSDSSTNAVEN